MHIFIFFYQFTQHCFKIMVIWAKHVKLLTFLLLLVIFKLSLQFVLFSIYVYTLGSSLELTSRVSLDGCSGRNTTIYVYPPQKEAEVKLPNSVEATLPIGLSKFKIAYGSDVCTFHVEVVGKTYLPFLQ